MVEAYVLVNAESGRAGRALSGQMAAITGVVSAEDLSGPFDVIARIAARDLDQLAKLVASKIQAVGGVTRTLLCPIVHLE